MTNNIEKLYELAKVKKKYYSFKTEKEEFTWELDENGNDKHNCIFCGEPEIKTRHFTPAKQLELIKWLILNPFIDEISLYYNEPSKTYNIEIYNIPECGNFRDSRIEFNSEFEHTLAGLVCELWEDLTEQQRKEVRGILCQ